MPTVTLLVYQHERHHLKFGRQADYISFLLLNHTAIKPLLKFIHATQRFKTSPNSARHDITAANGTQAATLPADVFSPSPPPFSTNPF